MENSNIEWTDHTFNPWIGCMKISEGCKNCYAETFMTRKPRWANTWGPASTTTRLKTSAANWRNPLKWNRAAEKAGERKKVFCASLADVFEDNSLLVAWRRELFEMIADTSHLDWLLLTKRPENVMPMIGEMCWSATGCSMWNEGNDLWPNIAIGTSVESQTTADERIPALLEIPAAVRFLSIEPLLGAVDLSPWLWEEAGPTWAGSNPSPDIDWVIVGGESGPNARPMKARWVRSIRDQCLETGTAFFFKQWGGPNKKAAGRILDGREWGQMPAIPQPA